VGTGAQVPRSARGAAVESGLDWTGGEKASHPRIQHTRQLGELSARGERSPAVSHTPTWSSAWEYYKPDTGSETRETRLHASALDTL